MYLQFEKIYTDWEEGYGFTVTSNVIASNHNCFCVLFLLFFIVYICFIMYFLLTAYVYVSPVIEESKRV